MNKPARPTTGTGSTQAEAAAPAAAAPDAWHRKHPMVSFQLPIAGLYDLLGWPRMPSS
jgi:hypothetical protein